MFHFKTITSMIQLLASLSKVCFCEYNYSRFELYPSGDHDNFMFGYDVAMSDDYAIVTSPCNNNIYIYDTINFQQSQILYIETSKSINCTTNDVYTYTSNDWSVSIYQHWFVVGGAYLENVFVFRLNQTTINNNNSNNTNNTFSEKWYQTDILSCQDAINQFELNLNDTDYGYDYYDCSTFGTSIDITNNYIIITNK